jgi:hypothetical protein
MKSKTKRILIISTACLLLLFAGEEFFRRVLGGFAGSFPYVEYWEINATETEIIDAIKELKKDDSSLQPPNQTELTSKRDTGYIWTSDEMIAYKEKLKKDSLTPLPEQNYSNYYHDYWLYIDFYYADTKEVVHTWTRPGLSQNITTFALYSFTDIDKPTEHRLINKDFWYLANKIQINKFKKTIVDRIQAKIDKKKSGS